MPVRPHDGGRGEREREVHQLEFRLLHPLCHCVAHSHTHRLGNHKQLGGGLPDSDLLYAALIHPLLRQIAALRQVQAGGEPESASFRNRKVPLPSDPNQLFSCPSDVQRAAIVCRTNHLR
ncbi:unnamed protein product [Linum trigynum]|uniref:Uncharacterized protein n=1 Tax=Linum trigynum TaxID=586398 RepID=A0AAV2F851_9ROSI